MSWWAIDKKGRNAVKLRLRSCFDSAQHEVLSSLVGQEPCAEGPPEEGSCQESFWDLPKTIGWWLLCVTYALVRHVDNANSTDTFCQWGVVSWRHEMAKTLLRDA
jgi:hypothetical protein